MKLPDYSQFENLNKLRKAMGADLVSEMSVSYSGGLDADLLRELRDGGLDVDVSDIEIGVEGVFEYKGKKVFVYIRDQWGDRETGEAMDYKFHVTSCRTIDKMFKNERGQRYVVSTRMDGQFRVNLNRYFPRELLKENEILPMSVCKNCLLQVRYLGYSGHKDSIAKEIYSKFKPEEYISKYETRFKQVPAVNDVTAPRSAGIYTEDWSKISKYFREKNNWKCQGDCLKDFSKNKKDLHLHHVDGNPQNNSPVNLKVLCKWCHSDQPGSRAYEKKSLN